MGNSIKRQLLTAAVTLSLLVLGSAGVSSAGILTVLDGTFKGKLWSGTVASQRLAGGDAAKTKIKDDFVLIWSFDDFPDVDALVRVDTREFVMDGIAVRRSDKKGEFVIAGPEVNLGNDSNLFMQGKYKSFDDDDCAILLVLCQVPTDMKGKWFMDVLESLVFGDFDQVGAVAGVTQTGSFKAKGDGNILAAVPIP